jgi:hypothetical protein
MVSGGHGYLGVKSNSKTQLVVKHALKNVEPFLANWALKFQKFRKC